MNKKLIWSLAVLNVALLAVLIFRASSENTAQAQAARRPNDVVMIPGELPSGGTAVVYLVDVGNHRLSAMAFSGQDVEFLAPPLDLDRVFEGASVGANTENTNPRTGRNR